ncbi:MAG: hypothetical protein JO087_20780 [Actinobacteria bacterium]|nr:hypothetical protein [Actinomycetota bacterium]
MPTNLDDYAAFVTTVVQRYAPLGVHEYALENEVNAPGHWTGTPADYERLVTAGARAVHAADPTAKVADGGLGSTVYGGVLAQDLLDQGKDAEAVAAYRQYYARRFEVRGDQLPQATTAADLRTALAGDQLVRNRQYFDATLDLVRNHVVDLFQLHFYEAPDVIGSLTSMLHAHLPADFPVQAWEVGQFWPNAPEDPAVHADQTKRVVCGLVSGGVQRIIWLPLGYNPNGRNATELRFGLLDPNGTTRPAATTFLALRQPQTACAKLD